MTDTDDEEQARVDTADLKRLDRTLAQLSEHYDSVQIIATRHVGSSTRIIDRGTGNWYSRLGAVVEWLECEKARTHANAQRERKDDDE